jgi:redox-sensitive bicupin YhaK (pirin superfamily)
VAPDGDSAVWINQDAWLSLGNLEAGKKEVYPVHKEGNGVYVFVLEGTIKIGDVELNKRDATGIWETSEIEIEAVTNTEILVIDVPMDIDDNE